MRARIGRVVWFDIYGEEDWHEGNPARMFKLEAIGRITRERAEGKTFIVVSPHNSISDKQKFYDLKIPKGNVIRIDYWDDSGKLPDTSD